MARVVARRESALDPADFQMVGVLGRVSMPIRTGGTGEITFSQGRTRRCSGARRDGDGEIGRGSEVIVTRYEKGIAYVRRWDELSGEAYPAEAGVVMDRLTASACAVRIGESCERIAQAASAA